ncbi:MAG: hypothetical protein SFW62_08955 [Alphaproteobacteria bacterium]|nr:hypothetical protein [Alphaproteobacteria bacterium]
MAIASLSFSAALPTYTSIGSAGTIFAGNSLAATGAVAVNTNGASASSGQATILTSSLKSGGLSFLPQSASTVGNLLTVIYGLSPNASPSDIFRASDQARALAGGLYGTGINITPGTVAVNGNSATTSYRLSINGPVDGVGGTINLQDGLSFSESADGSRLSLESISTVGNDLRITYRLSDAPERIAATTTTRTTDTSNPSSDRLGAEFASSGITTLGDLLAAAAGFSSANSLTGALQSRFTSVPHPTAALASALGPSPSSAFQIGDFLNIGGSAPSLNSDLFTSSANDSVSSGNTLTGIYTSVASLGTSTIRGAGLNVVA